MLRLDEELGNGEVLQATNIRVYFDGVRAVDGVNLRLQSGEILGLIGPNGAGKTTLVNVLSGFQRSQSGTVTLEREDITGWPPDRIARTGVARTFQGTRSLLDLTILENVEVGAVGVGARRAEARTLAWKLLRRVRLREKATLVAGSLPHGDERRLGIARALASRPRFLLLDEPGSGLNDGETDELVDVLSWVRRELRVGVLVIEHDMRMVMRLCDRIQVLDHGKTIALGDWDEIRHHPQVLDAYLGAHQESHDARD